MAFNRTELTRLTIGASPSLVRISSTKDRLLPSTVYWPPKRAGFDFGVGFADRFENDLPRRQYRIDIHVGDQAQIFNRIKIKRIIHRHDEMVVFFGNRQQRILKGDVLGNFAAASRSMAVSVKSSTGTFSRLDRAASNWASLT